MHRVFTIVSSFNGANNWQSNPSSRFDVKRPRPGHCRHQNIREIEYNP